MQGFTIIEVTLFLAVSGLLMMGILGGAMSGINQQRYRDATTTLQSQMHQLYIDTLNVHSLSVNQDLECIEPSGSAASGIRGRTGCLLLGRFMQIDTGGNYEVYNVVSTQVQSIGTVAGCAAEDARGIDVFAGCGLQVDAANVESGSVGWGATLSWPREGGGSRPHPDSDPNRLGAERELALLVLRSPNTGHVYTFTGDRAEEQPSTNYLQALIRNGREGEYHGTTHRVVCVDPTGMTIAEPMAILIRQNATSSQHIELVSGNLIGESGWDTRC